MPVAQFAYRKGLGCTDALLTIYHLQRSLDAGMESYIVQLDFRTAFDGVSHRGLLFKLESIGVCGSVLSICTEFFTDCRQRVVVNGAVTEWIPIISSMPQGSVLDALQALVASQQTNLLLLPPLTRTWLEFRTGAITGA